jgi:hypothetical protein
MIYAEMDMKYASSWSVDQAQKSEEIALKSNIEFTPQMDGVIDL